MQARYTDLLVLNKWELASERQLDTVLDHLNDASPETPIVRSDKVRRIHRSYITVAPAPPLTPPPPYPRVACPPTSSSG
jgi:G3E family GTPase